MGGFYLPSVRQEQRMRRHWSISGAGIAAPVVAALTWNPADKASEITLSGGDLVATRSGTNNNQWRLVRVTQSRTSGKRYVEIENTADAVNGLLVGVCPSSLSTSAYPGSTATSYGYHCNDAGSGACYNNGAGSLADGNKVAQGSYARIAIDFDAGKLWFGNAANWKGGGDPAAGTTPSFTFTANSDLFIAAGEYVSGQVATLRATGFTGVAPTGFVAW